MMQSIGKSYKETLIEILRSLAPALLRWGMSLVFLYFGTSQLRTPEGFIGFLPKEAALLPISARNFVILNGAFEVLAGSLLLLGLYTRVCAFLLGAHLMGITFTLGYNQIGVRDFGLSIAAISVSFFGPDSLGLDHFFASKAKEGSSSG